VIAESVPASTANKVQSPSERDGGERGTEGAIAPRSIFHSRAKRARARHEFLRAIVVPNSALEIRRYLPGHEELVVAGVPNISAGVHDPVTDRARGAGLAAPRKLDVAERVPRKNNAVIPSFPIPAAPGGFIFSDIPLGVPPLEGIRKGEAGVRYRVVYSRL